MKLHVWLTAGIFLLASILAACNRAKLVEMIGSPEPVREVASLAAPPSSTVAASLTSAPSDTPTLVVMATVTYSPEKVATQAKDLVGQWFLHVSGAGGTVQFDTISSIDGERPIASTI